jgi:hypothetical protein
MEQHDPNIDARLRTMMILWFALFCSVGMYLAFCYIALERPAEPGNRALSFVFAAVATFMVILSFVIKQKLLRKSVDEQNLMLVQQAFVVAWAMCEVSAILGLIEYLLLDTKDYIVLFALAVVGMALHFPTRRHLLNASFKMKA